MSGHQLTQHCSRLPRELVQIFYTLKPLPLPLRSFTSHSREMTPSPPSQKRQLPVGRNLPDIYHQTYQLSSLPPILLPLTKMRDFLLLLKSKPSTILPLIFFHLRSFLLLTVHSRSHLQILCLAINSLPSILKRAQVCLTLNKDKTTFLDPKYHLNPSQALFPGHSQSCLTFFIIK